MSFYQPSLSLYDVLDALTNKANVRGDYADDFYSNRVPQRRREPYSDRKQRYQPERSYYTIPNTPYYQPFYYSREEPEPAEQPVFPHYHRYNPNVRRRPSSTERVGGPSLSSVSGDNLVEALLNALTGDSSGLYSNESEEQERDPAEDKEEQETAKAIKEAILDRLRGNNANLNGLDEEAQDSVKDEKADDQDSGYDDEYNEDYNMQNAGDNKAEEGQKDKTSSYPEEEEEEEKVSPSEGKSVFRSPVPAPLQVSNPQISLDLPFSPDVNVYDTNESYLVLLALPGANSKEFKIDFHPSSHELQIKGTIENKSGIDEKFIKISEIKYGDFERTVKFPVLPRVKDEEIKASYCNGLLQIKVPKLPQDSVNPQPKKRILIEDVPDEELVFESSQHNL
ncbi:Hsp42 [Kluyveromyces marxianus]